MLDYLGNRAITEGDLSKGYLKFANGLMIQFGQTEQTTISAGQGEFTFPTAFINTDYKLFLTSKRGGGSTGSGWDYWKELRTTGFSAYIPDAGGLQGSSTATTNYLAIGAWK